MDTLTGQKKIFQLYDKSLSRIETPQGTLTLVSVFLPFFVEMLLTNSMGTVNTLVLSHYSDEAVASVGAANQLMGMIFTFYTVISTGASIFIFLLILLCPPNLQSTVRDASYFNIISHIKEFSNNEGVVD